METGKDSDQENYWLIQYQKLMDMKPDSVKLAEEKLDAKVKFKTLKKYFCHTPLVKVGFRYIQASHARL